MHSDLVLFSVHLKFSRSMAACMCFSKTVYNDLLKG